ncbi:hypothetical protein [Anaerosporobacter sp.]|uniref:hypothetical protein n=1 Tax=Anaerosporobacter sp. TaxID=1872529 RepID=UPI00286ED8AC|nr:hypothetical protein [Anaerosporobacter sp.]
MPPEFWTSTPLSGVHSTVKAFFKHALEQLTEGDDLVNKHGVKLTLEYIEYLNKKNAELKEQIALRDDFLKRLKSKI